jgi:hypothetical protein
MPARTLRMARSQTTAFFSGCASSSESNSTFAVFSRWLWQVTQ